MEETLKISVKATVDYLRLATLTEIIIKLPILQAQTKIEELLSNVNNLIEEEKRILMI